MNNKKAFGIVNIAPNEYVVHTRFGKIKNQGLGKTFFAWPFPCYHCKIHDTTNPSPRRDTPGRQKYRATTDRGWLPAA